MAVSTILGVFGGLGPAASAEFMRRLAALAPARCDQEHPVVYVYSNPQIPDRTDSILGKGPSPEADLKSGLMKLCEWGAGLLAVPCNTAHYFIDHFRAELPVPLVHIVESTLDDAQKIGPEGSWIIATGGTLYSGLYAVEAARRGYNLLEPDAATVDQLMKCIRLVKAGRLEESGIVIREVVESLWKVRELPIVCACTELPLAYDASGLPRDRAVSSIESLASACIRRLYGGE